jgi:hypothetical protein
LTEKERFVPVPLGIQVNYVGGGREAAGTLFLNPRSNFENEIGAENCAITFAVIVEMTLKAPAMSGGGGFGGYANVRYQT